ncbi:hypothetical protein V496_09159, partial [Pseudogymnoascus sp. VKM F-4515 (FW-2607)]
FRPITPCALQPHGHTPALRGLGVVVVPAPSGASSALLELATSSVFPVPQPGSRPRQESSVTQPRPSQGRDPGNDVDRCEYEPASPSGVGGLQIPIDPSHPIHSSHPRAFPNLSSRRDAILKLVSPRHGELHVPPVVNPTDLRRVRPDTGALEAGRARTRGGGNFFWGARMGAWVHGWGEEWDGGGGGGDTGNPIPETTGARRAVLDRRGAVGAGIAGIRWGWVIKVEKGGWDCSKKIRRWVWKRG